jgi:hypothetical protein
VTLDCPDAVLIGTGPFEIDHGTSKIPVGVVNNRHDLAHELLLRPNVEAEDLAKFISLALHGFIYRSGNILREPGRGFSVIVEFRGDELVSDLGGFARSGWARHEVPSRSVQGLVRGLVCDQAEMGTSFNVGI